MHFEVTFNHRAAELQPDLELSAPPQRSKGLDFELSAQPHRSLRLRGERVVNY